MRVHPSIAVHEVCFPATMNVESILEWAQDNGVHHVGLFSLRRAGDWAPAIRSVLASPVRVAYLSHASMFRLDDPASWAASTAQLIATIDAAKAMGAPMVYATTGPAGSLEFEDAVAALAQAIVPARDHAQNLGVKLLIETTSGQFCFTHFVHSFEDTVDVAAKAGIGVCLDLFATWYERGIRAKIVAAGDRISLVQVSDLIPRNMTASRDVIGEGIVPIERLLRCLFGTGYRGVVDLELFGRPDDTALEDIRKSLRALTVILDDIAH
jgi:sugar phosphate isomerase/epimerase